MGAYPAPNHMLLAPLDGTAELERRPAIIGPRHLKDALGAVDFFHAESLAELAYLQVGNEHPQCGQKCLLFRLRQGPPVAFAGVRLLVRRHAPDPAYGVVPARELLVEGLEEVLVRLKPLDAGLRDVR